MSVKMNFQRNLIALEDLLLGTGTVNQTRGTSIVPVTKINAANLPYDANLTLQQKIESLDTTQYVDGDNLPVYIATPKSATDLNLLDVIWIKTISSTERHVYYYDKIMFKYNPTDGNLILDPSLFDSSVATLTAAYQAADAVVTAAMTALITSTAASLQSADSAIRAEFAAADSALISSLNLGSAASKDVGTGALNVVQLNSDSKLPAVDGSLLTNLPAATAAVGSVVQRTYNESTAVTSYNSLIPRAGSAPANTVGTELLTRTITPKAVGNKLLIDFKGTGHPDAAGVAPCALLFIDGVFIRGAYASSPNNLSTNPSTLSIVYEHTAADLDPVVVSIRVGPTVNAGNVKFNDNSWGATGEAATLVIQEVKV